MNIVAQLRTEDRYVTVDGLRLRYIEHGAGPSVLFLHGASLGSSADVFSRNLSAFAQAGFRAIAFDLPGFGLSDVPAKQSIALQRNSIPKFIDALELGRTALVSQSRSGGMAVQLALDNPDKYACVVAMAALPLLPPEPAATGARPPSSGSAEAKPEPTLADARKQLEADTYNHDRISDADVVLWHSRMIGKNFAAHRERENAAAPAGPKGAEMKPLWQRLSELSIPLLLMYGREDRGRAADRALSLKASYPDLDLHILEHCKHMVPWDGEEILTKLAIPLIKNSFGKV